MSVVDEDVDTDPAQRLAGLAAEAEHAADVPSFGTTTLMPLVRCPSRAVTARAVVESLRAGIPGLAVDAGAACAGRHRHDPVAARIKAGDRVGAAGIGGGLAHRRFGMAGDESARVLDPAAVGAGDNAADLRGALHDRVDAAGHLVRAELDLVGLRVGELALVPLRRPGPWRDRQERVRGSRTARGEQDRIAARIETRSRRICRFRFLSSRFPRRTTCPRPRRRSPRAVCRRVRHPSGQPSGVRGSGCSGLTRHGPGARRGAAIRPSPRHRNTRGRDRSRLYWTATPAAG